eukprot:971508-Amphidinium_carterae.1
MSLHIAKALFNVSVVCEAVLELYSSPRSPAQPSDLEPFLTSSGADKVSVDIQWNPNCGPISLPTSVDHFAPFNMGLLGTLGIFMVPCLAH